MNHERWRKLQDLFMEARAVQGAERERLLREHARSDAALVDEVNALLVADVSTGAIEELAPRLFSLSKLLLTSTPERIGPYRIIGELGRGGMGVVYHAERDDGHFQQRVAIKLISSTSTDDPLHQRFLAERQILAGLVHPNIARLLDGGLTDDGRPYLVLEFVDGQPITTYCDRNRLDLAARLRLFMDVCAAVQHAHQNLVIHRDLKPSNILVSNDGRVHLLDFGIAKLINPTLVSAQMPVTRLEQRAMTPEYASPEQIRGEALTTSSDIYSLGVLLYELLCGSPPYQLATKSPVEVATAICEEDPKPPSQRIKRAELPDAATARAASSDRLARELSGDLDSIVLMAMRKEPARRYASADMLRQDVQRYLTGGTVLAHRGTRRYRVEKFVRRHRVEVVATIVVFAALSTGLSLAVTQSRTARRERDRAQQALNESEGMTTFLMELFRTSEYEETPATQLTASDLLERGAQRAHELASQPIVHARLIDVIGQMSLHMGRFEEAQRLLEQALTIRRATLGPAALEVASTSIHLARVHRTRRDFDSAHQLVSSALQIRQQALPPGHPDIAEAFYELGWVSSGAEQERLYREALRILPDTGAAAEKRVTVLQALSTALRRQGRLSEAVAADRDALRVAELAFGPAHHVTGAAMIHLADHVRDIEQNYASAERLFRRGITLVTTRYGENSIRLLHGLNSLGALLSARGDAEAEQVFRRALSIRETATGTDHPLLGDNMQLLGGELLRQRRFREAETLAHRALEHTTRALGERHPAVTNGRLPFLAEVLSAQGRTAEADQTYRFAFERSQQLSAPRGEMLRAYGRMLTRHRDFARAEVQLLESLAVLERTYSGQQHPNAQETRRALMELYEEWGKPELVEKYRVPPGKYVPY